MPSLPRPVQPRELQDIASSVDACRILLTAARAATPIEAERRDMTTCLIYLQRAMDVVLEVRQRKPIRDATEDQKRQPDDDPDGSGGAGG